MIKYKIIEQISRNKDGTAISDLVKLGYNLSTTRSIISRLEQEGVLIFKKIGTTKLYFIPPGLKSDYLISLIKKAEYYGLTLDLLFKNKELFVKFYNTPIVRKIDVESCLSLTNASVLIKKLEKHNLIRIVKRKPLEFCFKQNDAIELFLSYFGITVSKRVRYDYNATNSSYLSLSRVEHLTKLKSDFYNVIKFYSSKADAFERFLGYFIYNSCGIEGNKIKLRDTPQILKEGLIPINVKQKDYVDYINSKDIILKVLIENDFRQDIDHDLIRNINKKILDRVHVKGGEYRTEGFNLRPFGAGFKSTPGKYVKIDMDWLIKIYYSLKKEGLHPLIIATIFHHKFEKIHPFFEGNGRTGRILLNYILMRAGFPPLIVEKRNKRRYYNSLGYADKHAQNMEDISVSAYKKLFQYFLKQIDSTFHVCFKV